MISTYIYGAGKYGVLTALDCEQKGVKIAGFIDSNEELWGTKKNNLIIYPPNEILKKQDIQVVIAVANTDIVEEISNICNKANVKNLTISEFKIQFKKQQTLETLCNTKSLECKNSPKYIVSLTSYGERLSATAPYAITTLLNQNIQPDKIILWVAHEDKEKVPSIMEKLVEKGLEIRFCEDIKSYKKLIPALQEFPDDYIITADDDVYYPQNWFEQLIIEHEKNPKKIICHRAHGIKVDEKHNLLPYINWDFCIEPSIYFAKVWIAQDKKIRRHKFESIFPTGGAGALYPPHCLYKDITNEKLFMELTPKSDDIWFWAIAVLNKEYFGEESPYIVIENGYSKDLQDIEPEQQLNGNALNNYNVSENGNDKQLKAVIEHYPQIKEILKHILSSSSRRLVY